MNQDPLQSGQEPALQHDPAPSSSPAAGLARPKRGSWLTNLLILVLATILMLALCEGLMRLLDGYQLLNFDLNPAPSYQQPPAGAGDR